MITCCTCIARESHVWRSSYRVSCTVARASRVYKRKDYGCAMVGVEEENI